MLINAIIALFILVIIIGAIDYFDNLQTDISTQSLLEGFDSAVQSPNGDVILKHSLVLNEGAYTLRNFSSSSKISEECIILQSVSYTSMFLSDTGKSIVVKSTLQTDVYFQCTTENNSPACETQCIISFGIPIKK